MARSERIEQRYADATLNIALDTLANGKQALVFCNTKRGAESQAERIAQKAKDSDRKLEHLAEQVLAAVGAPTKQCKRLALCIRSGIAFHHSGLHPKQRDIVETHFRDGTIKIICATPTLAMGMDLPAFRSIIRDLKRYSAGTSWGMADIPVLEYEQMAGRAGRPGKEEYGEAICIAQSEAEKERIIEKYLRGDPEDIYSKLAVEPVLRTYVLSLIASGYVHDHESLYRFFDQTFYAWQYGDTDKLHRILDRMVMLLQQWGFLDGSSAQDGFVAASDMAIGELRATLLGERVAQLYLDPYTANHLLTALDHGMKRQLRLKELPLLHLLCTTIEMRPLCTVRQSELEEIDRILLAAEDELFVRSPTIYSHEYEEFLQTVKTAAVLQAWIGESGEDEIMERFNVSPGELHGKRENADWLLYSLAELAKLKRWQPMIAELDRLRVRLEHGAKEELLALLRLRGIGRVRARKLYQNRIRSIEELKAAEYSTLRALLGERIAADVKEQVGQKVNPEDRASRHAKRATSLADFDRPQSS